MLLVVGVTIQVTHGDATLYNCLVIAMMARRGADKHRKDRVISRVPDDARGESFEV